MALPNPQLEHRVRTELGFARESVPPALLDVAEPDDAVPSGSGPRRPRQPTPPHREAPAARILENCEAVSVSFSGVPISVPSFRPLVNPTEQ